MASANMLIADYIRSGLVAPTDSPTDVAIYIDKVGGGLYFWDGTDWDQLASSGGTNTFTDTVTIDMGAVGGTEGLVLETTALVGAGVRDSPVQVMRGHGFLATDREVDYLVGVVVTAADGTNDALVWSREYNGGGPAPLMTLDNDGNLIIVGDIDAAGGYRSMLPFSLAALAAAQVLTPLNCGEVALRWIAQRSGSITGLSANMDVGVTGGSVTVIVIVDGINVMQVVFPNGGIFADRVIEAPGIIPFAAGAEVEIVYTSTGIAETPALLAVVEVTM